MTLENGWKNCEKITIEEIIDKIMVIDLHFQVFLFFIFVILLFTFTLLFHRDIQTYFQEKREISYTEFVSKTQKGDFSEINEKDDKLISQVKENGKDVLYYTKK